MDDFEQRLLDVLDRVTSTLDLVDQSIARSDATMKALQSDLQLASQVLASLPV